MTTTCIPLTIIGGYLGVGKTTLLNHIIFNNDGRRLAVVVNDFGSINIDAELIESQDGETIGLENGCICCTMSSGFYQVLVWLLQREPPPEHIVVEASGVADPFEVAQYGRAPGLRLDGIIVVADVETVRQKAKDAYMGWMFEKQLTGADVIVLNKIDLVEADALKDVRTWLQGLVPDARIVEAAHGIVPLPILLGVYETTKPVRIASPEHHHPDDEYETWSLTGEQPLNGDAFRSMVENLPEGIIRAKGILYLQENTHQRYIFQLVGKRWSLKAGEAWEDEHPTTKVVMIGLAGCIDHHKVEQMLKRKIKHHS